MTRAAIYTRVSLDRTGDLLAVDRQRADCLAIIQRRGWELVEEFSDNSVSASKKSVRRPGYDAMVAAFADGRFDALVCWDLDRLTRQPRQLEDWIDASAERGLKLVTANGEADLTTDAGRLFARIKAAVAREEIERKGARQRRAAQQRVESGGMSSFKPCLGYTSANAIVVDEADVVRQLFERFAAGDTIYGLRQWLSASQFTPKQSSQWSFTTVRDMLRNPRYAARVVHRGDVTPHRGSWEPIVSEALFDSVQAILDDPRRKTNRVGTERRHLLSGIAVCGVCGSRARGRNLAYFCPNGCVTKARATTDSIVIGVIEARLATVDLEPPRPRNDEPAIDTRVIELRARLQTIEGDYDSGLIDGRRYATSSEKVRAELLQAEKQRAVNVGRSALQSLTTNGDPVEAFRTAPLAVRRAVIDALLRVTLLKRDTHSAGAFDLDSVRLEWVSNETH